MRKIILTRKIHSIAVDHTWLAVYGKEQHMKAAGSVKGKVE